MVTCSLSISLRKSDGIRAQSRTSTRIGKLLSAKAFFSSCSFLQGRDGSSGLRTTKSSFAGFVGRFAHPAAVSQNFDPGYMFAKQPAQLIQMLVFQFKSLQALTSPAVSWHQPGLLATTLWFPRQILHRNRVL